MEQEQQESSETSMAAPEQQGSEQRFGEDLGRIFEIGFNTGFLAAITQQPKLKTYFGDLYINDLKHLRKQSLLNALYKRTGVINQLDKEQLQRWMLYFSHKGYLAGLNLFTEYLQSFAHHRKNIPRELVYLQCNFYGQNSFYIYNKNDKAAVQGLMQQFRTFKTTAFSMDEIEIKAHRTRGKFLNADTLLLLKYGRYWRILCIDLSVFSLRHLDEATDLNNIENIRTILSAELYYNRAKSVFSNMGIDTEQQAFTHDLLSGQLKTYFTAFKRNDKETVKLIQAASYAEDFYAFLLRKDILTASDPVLFNIIGYTDRAINAMSVNQDQISLLKTCAEIYQHHTSDKNIGEARDAVLSKIQRAARKGFGGSKDFVEKLVHLVDDGDAPQWLTHDESIENFLNTRVPLSENDLSPRLQAELRPEEYRNQNILDVHARLTHEALEGSTPYLFLTGNPGIGKTTAIVNFLKRARKQGQGFLFLYISPRKHVNTDIIQKFRETTDTELPCPEIFGLTSDSLIIRNAGGKGKVVHYYSDQRNDAFHDKNVSFIHADSDEAKRQQARARELEEIQEGLLIARGERISGVLDSLCAALHAMVEKPQVQALVATVAVQSLKRLKDAQKTTLHHLNTIFKGVYNERGQAIPHKIQELSQHVRHLFIMIDEVTGDESGVEFLHGLHTFLQDRQLLDSPLINTKIIVADASIVDPQIIKQHLENTTYELDKIYFRRVEPNTNQAYALHREAFHFLRKSAIVINANAYPASKLHITYKIGVDALQFDPTTFTERSKQLEQEKKQKIVSDILTTLDNPLVSQQLVYIQDKRRLAELIQIIKGRRSFEPNSDYLEINANISEKDKEDIKAFRKTAKVIFMTASASRGLSFPEATRILVDIPHFEIEQNLMEILQVVYRGRGHEKRDQEEKHLLFYLTDQVIYNESADRPYSVRENMLHLLNILLILKTSLMTRIAGCLKLGVNQHFMMIPIGGKSVDSAGETFTSRISNLIREAQTLSHRFYSDKRLSVVQESLIRTLENVRISLRPLATQKSDEDEIKRANYIAQLPTFAHEFDLRMRQGFDQLLTLPPLEIAHVNGSLLVVPIINMSMQEAYWMQFEQVYKRNKAMGIDLLTAMRDLSTDSRYPPSFQNALKDGMALIKALQEMAEHKIPHYEQESSHTDQHYALPIAVFLLHREMSEHFADKQEPLDQENPLRLPFHALLARYIRTLYPADGMLPIGQQYDDFPFLVFRSLNVSEARSKMFTGKYLFMSRELNIINMLLSSTRE